MPALLVLASNTPWVAALAEAMAESCHVHAVRLYDWRTARHRPPEGVWSPVGTGRLERTTLVMPPGYAGRFERFVRSLMRAHLRRWVATLADGGEEAWVLAPYPYAEPWLRALRTERIVYFNLDEYTLYQPARARRTLELEGALVARAAVVLCLSAAQVATFRMRYPDAAHKLWHFPLGVSESFLNPSPCEGVLRGTVGYVGNLTDRVDWRLVHDVAQLLPTWRFVFVGAPEELITGGERETWRAERASALALPNVESVGRVDQREVMRQYWTFDVNWIPYDVTHPFNRASCPTKIMDGLASGRPIVSTAVPECELYPDHIAIAHSARSVAAAIEQRALAWDAARAGSQTAFARAHTWVARARELSAILEEACGPTGSARGQRSSGRLPRPGATAP